MKNVKKWLADRIGIVRLRQIVEDISHRLAFIPVALVGVALVLSQASLAFDRAIGDVDVPLPLSTTVDSARSIFGTIAGGLITAVTLLLSIMLVAVQLASAQFSPRTLRNWLGDRTLRVSVGVVLGTTVFCLMGLRSVRDDVEGSVIPTVTVLVAVVLGVASLVVMIRAVDHVTRSLQVGTVAQQLVDQTIETISTTEGPRVNEDPMNVPAHPAAGRDADRPPSDARAIETDTSGWVQQIDESGILDALPDGAHVWVDVAHGAYLTTSSPLAYVDDSHGEPLDDEGVEAIKRSFALGPTRTMQQDVGFGLQQLTDIAVRALSPGVNDPQTACDIVVNIGEVLREIWTHPQAPPTISDGRASLHRLAPAHAEHLRAALDPIRRYGRSDPNLMSTMSAMLRRLRDEVSRRDLAGPAQPLDEYLDELLGFADDADWLPRERRRFRGDDTDSPTTAADRAR